MRAAPASVAAVAAGAAGRRGVAVASGPSALSAARRNAAAGAGAAVLLQRPAVVAAAASAASASSSAAAAPARAAVAAAVSSCTRGLSGTGRGGGDAAPLRETRLHALHARRGGKFVDFAGWSMPVNYAGQSVMQEHNHTRTVASIFDVSHMCQLKLTGALRLEFLESLIVGDLHELEEDSARLTLFTNEEGGIIDDSVVTRRGDHVYFVVNAGCAEKDLVHIRAQLERFREARGAEAADLELTELNETRSLIALQGPQAEEALAGVLGAAGGAGDAAGVTAMGFMTCRDAEWQGHPLIVSRCGYTGEDGYEISVPHEAVDAMVESLLAQPLRAPGSADAPHENVRLAGLAARDSLRLEAGLCLYGNDMDETVTPIEATLLWTVSKSRRQPGAFLGADKILHQIKTKEGVRFKRIGFRATGPPARQGAKLYLPGGTEPVGTVTSGSFGPTVKGAVGMAHIDVPLAKAGTELEVEVRGKRHTATVEKMPFVPQNYKK